MADPSLQSRNYYFDPDGVNLGDNRIFVNCNMSIGIIRLLYTYTDVI